MHAVKVLYACLLITAKCLAVGDVNVNAFFTKCAFQRNQLNASATYRFRRVFFVVLIHAGFSCL